MHYLLISLKDRAVNAFQPVGNVRSEYEAFRVFKDLVSQPDTPQNRHPDDYDLYILGTLDDQSGLITPEATPRKIADGKTIKETLVQF